MEKQKDCELIFCDKQIHKFFNGDIVRALQYASEHKSTVWAIKTPWGVFQPMSPEEFDNVFDAVMSPVDDDSIPEDLIA